MRSIANAKHDGTESRIKATRAHNSVRDTLERQRKFKRRLSYGADELKPTLTDKAGWGRRYSICAGRFRSR